MLDAWRRHPSSSAVDAQLAAARARLNAAGRPLYNPEATFDAEDGGPDRTVTGGISLTLDIRNKRGARRDAAAARLTLAEARAQLIRQQFVLQWLKSWADLQSARERVAIGERRIASVQRFRDVARKQFAAQDISGLERDLAQLALDEAHAEQSTLLAELADSEARLRAVGGAPEAFVAKGLPTEQLPLRVSPVRDDLTLPPELQVATAEALATQREVAVATRNRAADPTIGLRAGRIDLEDGRSDTVAGVSVSIPLFVRNNYRAEVTAAQADAAAAQAEATRVRLQLEAERQRAIASYAAARAAWARWESSRGTDVDRRTALLERLLREGELSPSDYLQQLKQTLDTQLAGAELEARVWRSWADYLAATGQLDRWAGLDGTP
jgi:cobalt-zinc-cadmium efflux system outer membrane protein